jgi:lambda repressor-like predicted transcriptional regulator
MPRVRKLEAQKTPIALTYSNLGWTIRQLASFHNVSPGTIRNVLKREGVVLRNRGRRPNSEPRKV